MGGLRTSMATCGYQDIAEFNRAELMVAPALQSEGKPLQREQAIGMGARGNAQPSRAASMAEPVTEPTEVVSAGPGSSLPAEQGVEELALERAVAADEVVVLDYGGQYSQLIARRVRECGVFSELLPHHVGVEEVRRRNPKGLILSGGPASVYAPAPRGWIRSCWSSGSPCSASATACRRSCSRSAAASRAPRWGSSAARS